MNEEAEVSGVKDGFECVARIKAEKIFSWAVTVCEYNVAEAVYEDLGARGKC